MDVIERAVNRALPAKWQDDLARALIGAWGKAARKHANPATVRRIAHELELRIRSISGSPETPRTRLRTYAARLLRAKTPDRILRRLLDAESERLLAPLVTRAEPLAHAATEQLVAEAGLTKTAQRLHRYVSRYNWDDGVEPMRDLIEDEACAIGTALLVYWLARPHYYRQYVKRADVGSWERGGWDLVRRIERKLASKTEDRFYHLGIVFDPRSWEPGYDWTRDVYTQLPRRTELPARVWIRTTTLGVEAIAPAKKLRAGRRTRLR
jgi:hypothetical protein